MYKKNYTDTFEEFDFEIVFNNCINYSILFWILTIYSSNIIIKHINKTIINLVEFLKNIIMYQINFYC